jgi:hypothetical protein
MNECLGEIAVFQKSGGPLTKRIALGDDGKIINDSSTCRIANGLRGPRQVRDDAVRAPKGRAMTGSAREIAQALGKACREGRNWRCVCPLHGGHSLVLGDGDNALLVKCFGGNCATKDILAELRRRGLVEGRHREQWPARPPPSQPSNRDDHECQQHEKAAWLWSQRRPIKGTTAEKYLRQARAITCPLPPTLAFLPALKPEHSPAMLAAFATAHEIEPGVLGEPQKVEAVHLTLLRRDGSGKADVERPKMFIGSPGKFPIVIAPANDLLGLAITEGIEDGLTAHQVTGLGAWAAGSAGRMLALAQTLPG